MIILRLIDTAGYYFSLQFNGHFSRRTWVSRYQNVPILDNAQLRMMEVVLTTGAITSVKLQSNHHHRQTQTELCRSRLSFLSSNQQCQALKRNTRRIFKAKSCITVSMQLEKPVKNRQSTFASIQCSSRLSDCSFITRKLFPDSY